MTTKKPRYEVADVVHLHRRSFEATCQVSARQKQVLTNIGNCRTMTLGGHLDRCLSGCGFERISYNSCRDRHCSKCQGSQAAKWLTERMNKLLPVPYFHVVFTLPDDLHALALRNKKVVYGILFKAASQTLMQLGRDPKRLGADLAVTAVLHTWGQNLSLHPHLHCVVSGGGLSRDGSQWVAVSEKYLLPAAVLRKLFRGKFLALLQDAKDAGELMLSGTTEHLNEPRRWASFRDRLYRKKWHVYAKPPFGGPQKVFRYLGRYTHKVAISNHRIVDISNGNVTILVKDYKNGGKKGVLTLTGEEFLRRFLLHVLPKGFVRVRHYGLLAPANVNTKLVRAREIIDPEAAALLAAEAETEDEPLSWWERFQELSGIDLMACPCCGGRLARSAANMEELITGARSPPVQEGPD